MATVERSRAGALWCVAWTGLCLACFIILWVLLFHKRARDERRGWGGEEERTKATVRYEVRNGGKVRGEG